MTLNLIPTPPGYDPDVPAHWHEQWLNRQRIAAGIARLQSSATMSQTPATSTRIHPGWLIVGVIIGLFVTLGICFWLGG